MTYNDILKALFESTVLPPSKTLSSAWDFFEPNERHPFDWAIDDPVASADPDLAASQLRRKINCGVLNPTGGETQARAHGCAPLNAPPNPETFDVASESRWTLTMALAWVMWRSFDAVRAVEASWIAAHRTWVAFDHGSRHTPSSRALFEEALGTRDIPYDDKRQGWVLLPIALAPYAVLQKLDAFGFDGSMPGQTLEAAIKETWAALLDNELECEGQLEEGRWTKVAPIEWNSLSITTSDRAAGDRVIGDGRRYIDMRLSTRLVLERWPAPNSAVPRRIDSNDFKPEDKAAIVAAAESFFRQYPNATKKRVCAHLREQGWDFPHRFFDLRLWSAITEALPHAPLPKAGRPRKSPA